MAKKSARRPFWKKLHLCIVPHSDNGHHPHAIRHSALALYVAFILTFNVGYNLFVAQSSQVLGFATSISQQEVIRLTNVERQKAGVPAVQESALLNQAAMAKAQNMFAENYWAHYAPSGKSPWYWYDQVGYTYIYAGENLARDFDTSQGVINGWMNSPSHRQNMLTAHYVHIGIAVLNGVIDGHETTLVVQHFGTPATIAAAPPTSGSTNNPPAVVKSDLQSNLPPQSNPAPPVNEQSISQEIDIDSDTLVGGVPVAGVQSNWAQLSYNLLNPLPINGWGVQQVVVVAMLGGLMCLFVFDFAILHRQRVHRPHSHSLLHAGMMGIAIVVVLYSSMGGVL